MIMGRLSRKMVALSLSGLFLLGNCQYARACGPDWDTAIMVNGIHPDLPLKLFAAGNLGMLQPGYAKSYLIVAYRYLNDTPLTAEEQAGILRLWHHRLAEFSMESQFDGNGKTPD